jgi:Cys-tRNA(Pro)/Cys-tRNA(Cys) deacylase
VLDETVELFDRVYVSGGKRGLDVSLAPADLARVLDAAVAPLRA